MKDVRLEIWGVKGKFYPVAIGRADAHVSDWRGCNFRSYRLMRKGLDSVWEVLQKLKELKLVEERDNYRFEVLGYCDKFGKTYIGIPDGSWLAPWKGLVYEIGVALKDVSEVNPYTWQDHLAALRKRINIGVEFREFGIGGIPLCRYEGGHDAESKIKEILTQY